jgi:hypothetical protein
MLNTNSPLPSSQEFAQLVASRVTEFRQKTKLSITAIERHAGVSHGTLHRMLGIAAGDEGSFVYESAVIVMNWLQSPEAVALSESKNATGVTANA